MLEVLFRVIRVLRRVVVGELKDCTTRRFRAGNFER